MMSLRERWLLAVCVLTISGTATANVIWPALILQTYIASWAPISLGLLVELVVIRRLFQWGYLRSFGATFLANIASTLAGLLLITGAGLVLQIAFAPLAFLAPERFVEILFLVALVALSAWLNALIEAAAIARLYSVSFGRKAFLSLFIANTLSVGVALVTMLFYPPRF